MSDVQIIILSQRPDGMDVAQATWNGQTFEVASRHGASMAIARRLRDAGRPECSWEGWDSGRTQKRLYGPSLAALAALTVADTDRAGLKLVEWMPNPMFGANVMEGM